MLENRFVFDARSPTTGGRFPIPSSLPEGGAELLGAMLERAIAQSSRLHRRDFRIALGDLQVTATSAILRQVLETPFSMPSEGCDVAVPTLEAATIVDGELHYTLGETYAAYLMFTAPEQALLMNAATAAKHMVAGVAMTDRERDLVVTGLQQLHQERVTAWTRHIVHAMRNRLHGCKREEFGVTEVADVLRKLGAGTAP